MGGTQQLPKGESMAAVMQAYDKYLPGLISNTAAQQPGIAQQQLNSTLATQPLYNALNLQQAQNYSVPLAEVGQDVARSNALAGASTNLAQLNGAGGDVARAADKLSREVNPNYYKTQDAASSQSRNLLDSFNLGGLSAGEQNAAERGSNQYMNSTGNAGLSNPLNAISNAMNFGGMYDNKRANLASAIGVANNTSNTAQNTGFNPVSLALGQPNPATQSNFGTGTFSPTGANTQNQSGSNAFNFGSGTMGNLTGSNNAQIAANTSMSNANSPLSYMQGAGSMMGGVGSLGAGCCFIFLESYHGTMPIHVRQCRDKYYTTFPQVASGYKRMAKWLVPLMQKYSTVRALVWHTMVKPLTNYGLFVTRKDLSMRKYKWARQFWFSVWNKLGN